MPSSLTKNPSRKACEDIIRRILMTEVLEQGRNCHFKTAMDFMNYFESLYPTSPSLVKQVQRAIKAMDLPKDENGFFVINKSRQQLDSDRELSFLLKKTSAQISSLEGADTVFITASADYKDYLLQLIIESETLNGKFITIVNSSHGLLVYTNHASSFKQIMQSLMDQD